MAAAQPMGTQWVSGFSLWLRIILKLMDIITVTCQRDRELQRLQSQSIDRWVQGHVNHYIVVNELTKDLSSWHELLDPYYTRHTLHLSLGDTKIIRKSRQCEGWAKQQLLKLRAVQRLEHKAMILDSKNFFIADTDLSQWADQIGSGRVNLPRHLPFQSLCKIYGNLLDIEACPEQLEPITPFITDPRVIAAMPKQAFELDAEWYKTVGIPSEFLYYSIVAQKIGLLPSTGLKQPVFDYLFHAEHPNIDWTMPILTYFSNIKIMGCHYQFIEKLTAEGRVRFNDFLISRDLTPLDLD